jgi:hypothetical protein
MRSKVSGRGAAALGSVAAAMVMVVLGAGPAAASVLFCGGGRGPTAESAVQSALDDARTSAQSMGFYGECTIVGEPFLQHVIGDPYRGDFFRAGVNATCLP